MQLHGRARWLVLRRRPSWRAVAAVVAVVALSSTVSSGRVRLDPPGAAYGAVGARAERGYFSQMPFERVDLVTGSLSLRVPILTLPGNAGMDLTLAYTYQTQPVAKWTLSYSTVPLGIRDAVAPQEGEWTPTLMMPDGAEPRLFTGVVSGYWVTTDFTRYDSSTGTLYLPNGWVATYAPATQFSTVYELTQIADAYGNTITPSVVNGERILTQTVDDGGATRTRTVTIAEDGWVTTITYEGRTWTVTSTGPFAGHPSGAVVSIEPPAGPGWDFAYSTDTMTVTTPTGGTVAYGFAELDERRVVETITTGGRAITGGTWTVAYTPGATMTTTVTTPSARVLTYAHAWDEGPDGKLWTLTSRTLTADSTEVFRLERAYQSVAFGSLGNLKVLDTQDITQDGVTFTTDLDYSSTNFAEYLQPHTITESASNHGTTRVTTRTFDEDFAIYLLPKVASQTVTIGNESFTTTFAYEHATGFLEAQTAFGLTTGFARDSFGNLASVTDAHSHVTTTAFQWGVPATVTSPTATVTRAINPDGTVASETQAGKTTAWTHDSLGRPTIVTPAAGAPATTTYASDGSSVIATRGATSLTTTVDGFGRPIATEDAVGVKTTTAYDAEGRTIFQSAPFTGASGAGTSLEYDALGRVTKVIHADSAFVLSTYSGTSVTITDELNRATTQTWQPFGRPGGGRLTSVVDADAQTWTYGYNAAGSLTLVDPPGAAPNRTWTYNSANQLTAETQPESGTTTYTYSGGLLTSQTDARGLTTTYQHDAGHRLIAVVPPDPTERITLEYDAAGHRSRMVTGGLESRFTFDDAHRLTARQDFVNGKPFTTAYEFDDRDNLTKITYPSGRIVQYAVDAANRITKVYGATTGTIYAEDIAYHPSGPIAALAFGNGLNETLTLTSRLRPRRLQSGPLDVTYDYFANGNVASVDDARGGFDASYSYDVLDRLTGVSGFGATALTYDAYGHRLTKGTGGSAVSYTYSETTHRLTSASSALGYPEAATLTYDQAGNLTGDGALTFAYSSRNMLLMAQLTSTGATTRYHYDADGLRALKSGPSGPSYYIHGPGGRLLAEYAGSFSKEWPATGTTGLGPTLTLQWSAVPDATYVVCVDTVNNNACDTAWVSTSSAPTQALTDVAAGTYYWQVKATDGGGTALADAGTWWSFTINAQGVFGKVSPAGGAYVHTDDVVLAWHALPDNGYWVCWDTTDNDTCDGGWYPNGANTTKVLEGLGAGTYYWQVKEAAQGIEADAGQWWSFTKVTGTTGKLAPLSGTTNHGTDVGVSWSAVEDAGYWVCWDTTHNDACDTGWSPNGGQTWKVLEGLAAGTYYWQVRVQTESGTVETNGGEWWSFTVGSGTPPSSGTATVTREYVYLGGRLLAAIEAGTTTTWYHPDVLGSVRAITSSAGATLVRHDYAPFGESTSALDGDPRRFLGQELDAETGFDHFGARQYRNVWGRFAGVDPIFSAGARTNPQLWNRYAYALNGPLRYTDPSGLEPDDPGDKSGTDNQVDGVYFVSYQDAILGFFLEQTQWLNSAFGALQAASRMQISDEGVTFIVQFEGFSATVYNDQAGRPTIGYGHLIRPGEDFSAGITPAQALALFRTDLQGIVSDVNRLLKVRVNQKQFDALASFTFNLGATALARSTLLARINSRGIVSSHTFTDHRNARIGGKLSFSDGLYKRRWKEFCMWNGF